MHIILIDIINKHIRYCFTGVPETWEKPLNIYREFAVSKHTLEWKNVSSSFLKTIGKPVGAVTVLEVSTVLSADMHISRYADTYLGMLTHILVC